MRESLSPVFSRTIWIFLCFGLIIFGTQLIKAQEIKSLCENKSQRSGKVVCLNSKQTKQLATKKVAPVFPKSCRCLGKIAVYVKVNNDGKVISAFADKGHPLLRVASIEAINKWEFKAYKLNKINREFIGRVDFVFSSNGDVRF